MEGLVSLSSMEKDTVLRRFFRGGRMGEDGRGQGGDGGRRSADAAGAILSSLRKIIII